MLLFMSLDLIRVSRKNFKTIVNCYLWTIYFVQYNKSMHRYTTRIYVNHIYIYIQIVCVLGKVQNAQLFIEVLFRNTA